MQKSALLIAVLLLSGCQKKEQVNQGNASAAATPVTPAAQPKGDIKGTLLQVAQAKPSIAERKFCALVTETDQPEKLPEASYLDENTKARSAVETGYFTVSGLGTGQVTMTPTAKYVSLWKEVKPTVDSSGLCSTWCFGKSKLTELQNLQQAAPDKYLANGVMTLDPLPWATPEVVKVFGPSRNDGVYAPIALVFYKTGDTWEVEKR